MLYRVVRDILKVIFYIIFRPIVIGKENIDNIDTGCILIANHTKLRDPVLLAITTKRTINFMAKSELFSFKLFGYLMRKVYVFSVNRKTADVKAIKKSIDIINNGEVCGVFPEGHRSRSGKLENFEKGVSFLALQCKARVVPAYIDWGVFPQRAIVKYGEYIDIPLIAENIEKKDRIEILTEKLHENIEQIGESVKNSIRVKK